MKRAIEGRIRALANVHSLFVESRWIGAELSTIAAQELAPYAANDVARVRVDGPQVLLEPTVAQALAVIFHELATNAAKYGALVTTNGQIEIKWSHAADGQIALTWSEIDGPIVQMPDGPGFGSHLIEGTIGQLGGDARFDWRPEGLVCQIKPLGREPLQVSLDLML